VGGVYHALAVRGDAFCEYCIAEFLEAFFGVLGGCAFEEEDVEVCHCGVVLVWCCGRVLLNLHINK